MIMFRSKKLPKRLISVILILIMVLCTVQLSGCDVAQPEMTPGYYDTEYEGLTDKGATFLACGTGGRLDRIYEDGTVENIPLPILDKDLTQVLISKDITLVGGVSGALVYSLDGKAFELSKGVGNEHIMGLTQFKGMYYACTYSGKILVSDDGVSWKTANKLTGKPLIAIAAADNNIMAITSDTDIFKSEDGENWSLQNYNVAYKGLAREMTFTNMQNLDGAFYIVGISVEEPEIPTIMFSGSDAEVWAFISLAEINGKPPQEFYPITVNSVSSTAEELLVACDFGRLLTVTSCSSCNLITKVSDANLRCIAISDNDDTLLAAGENFEFNFQNVQEIQDVQER